MEHLLMLSTFDFSYKNRLMKLEDFPEHINNHQDLMKVMDYNNRYDGIIDKSFLYWALQNKISYGVILWFVKEFSQQTDPKILCGINTLFFPYTLYFDESGNCTKFRLKDDNGKLNSDWRNDFVLAGVAYEGNNPPIDIETLFASLKLQKTVTDVKLKHIADYNGEDVNRLLDIIKSQKLHIVLSTLTENKIYLHWSILSLLYYALVDIVDSVLDIADKYENACVKDVLYKYVKLDLEFFLRFLSQNNYPNIDKEKIYTFCEDFIDWIDARSPDSFCDYLKLKLLRKGFVDAQKQNELIFITDNIDKLLIDNFVPLYALRLSDFPNSTIYFDHCGIVEENISKYASFYAETKDTQYDFLVSSENKWIQLSDFISGLFAALFAFLNANDKTVIKNTIENLETLQTNNLKLLVRLINISREHNLYFDHMTCSLGQMDKFQYLIRLVSET